MSPTEIAAAKMEEVTSKMDDVQFDMDDVTSAIDEVGPFENVFIQECAQFEVLTDYIDSSLKELARGFAGELTMSSGMEKLEVAMYLGRVPIAWNKLA